MVFSLMVMLSQELIHLESLCHLLQDLWWFHYPPFVNKERERLYNKQFYLSEIQSGAQGMKQESGGWGRTLRHHLTQDIPMIPFVYGFQN
jgi:hypothetical protein